MYRNGTAILGVALLVILAVALPIDRSSQSGPGDRGPASAETRVLEPVEMPELGIKLRAGYYPEAEILKGCVLYLQGLGDSIRNHDPLFERLNKAGYRVISFDYMGQGGSEGSMNDTRVYVEPARASLKKYEIQEQADLIWARYKGVKNQLGQDCSTAKKLVLGWSTGGLAAYRIAHEKRADGVALIAPGLAPLKYVGEHMKITQASLTRDDFSDRANPRVDPIKPKSPLLVPLFALNLIATAKRAESWKIDPSIPGLVLLATDDSFVDADATIGLLEENAPHFQRRSYVDARHELDNETTDVSDDVHLSIIQFFDGISINNRAAK